MADRPAGEVDGPVDLATAPVQADCYVLRGVPFTTPIGSTPLRVDLYRPAGVTGALPLLVCLHGGGWVQGSRAAFGPVFDDSEDPFFARVARSGFVVASPDYRLSGEAVFPAQLDDVLAALGWLADAAPALGADAGRTVVWGESAGGHLAALAALDATGSPPTAAIDGLRVVGAVAWYAPSDLTTMAEQARPDAVARASDPDSREARLLGVAVEDAGELAVAASPVAHVHAGAPPFLLVHGDADRFVPVGQSRQLHDALTGAGAQSRLELVPGADHMWRGVTDPDALLIRSLAFVHEVTSG
jgi:acetyl esterase/lipase